MKQLVSVSGGLNSSEALKQTIDKHGKENTIAVFADVKGSGLSHFWSMPTVDNLLHERFGGEATDLYRFLWRLSSHFDIPIHRLEYDNRTIFTVMAENRAFRLWAGGRFVHKCSEVKKRLAIKRWVTENLREPFNMVLGFGWDEEHRLKQAQSFWGKELGCSVSSPLIADNCDTTRWLKECGIEYSKSYDDGFEHDNCNGGCIAAGQGHFANLYTKRRDVYMYWAYIEASLQRYIGKANTILKDERGGTTKPLSLYQFIPRIQSGDYQKLDFGGCGCFVGQSSLFDLVKVS